MGGRIHESVVIFSRALKVKENSPTAFFPATIDNTVDVAV
jgi:hypothetical protein